MEDLVDVLSSSVGSDEEDESNPDVVVTLGGITTVTTRGFSDHIS